MVYTLVSHTIQPFLCAASDPGRRRVCCHKWPLFLQQKKVAAFSPWACYFVSIRLHRSSGTRHETNCSADEINDGSSFTNRIPTTIWSPTTRDGKFQVSDGHAVHASSASDSRTPSCNGNAPFSATGASAIRHWQGHAAASRPRPSRHEHRASWSSASSPRTSRHGHEVFRPPIQPSAGNGHETSTQI